MDLCGLLVKEEELIDIIKHEQSMISDDDVETSDTDIDKHQKELGEVRDKILKKLHKEIKKRS